jgi:hypothetical protein
MNLKWIYNKIYYLSETKKNSENIEKAFSDFQGVTFTNKKDIINFNKKNIDSVNELVQYEVCIESKDFFF